MDREWQELDIENVPSDLFKPGAWEFQESYINDDRWAFPFMGVVGVSLHGSRTEKYRIRRPEGWEPEKCPTCGSHRKDLVYGRYGIYSKTDKSFRSKCGDKWHDEPKAPTHEEIMTPRYWKDNRGRWKQILAYHPDSEHGPYVIDGDGRNASWFINRESADIPPE